MLKTRKVLAAALTMSMIFAFASCKKQENKQEPITGTPISMYDYFALPDGEELVLEGYVQDKESLWKNSEGLTTCSFYIQTDVGGAYIYEASVTEDTYNAMTDGMLVRVQGIKSTWSDRPEITKGIVEVVGGNPYSAPYYEITSDEIPSAALNTRVCVNDAVIGKLDSGNVLEYGYNNQGGRGDNLYFLVTINDGNKTVSIPCTVDTHLVSASDEVYAAVENVVLGQTASVNGILSVRGSDYFILVTDITL